MPVLITQPEFFQEALDLLWLDINLPLGESSVEWLTNEECLVIDIHYLKGMTNLPDPNEPSQEHLKEMAAYFLGK